MTEFLENEIASITKINDEKRYWFIRTYSGGAFPNYYDKNYVGLGINNVPIQLMKEAKIEVKSRALLDDEIFELVNTAQNDENVMADRSAFLRLVDYIDEHTSYHNGQATKVATQLAHFENNIQIGDTIVIPSRHSSQFAIGTVESAPYTENNIETFKFKNEFHQYPSRRRKIKWERLIDKEDLQGDFRSITNSTYFGIANVDEYKDVIDGTIRSLYIRDTQAYLTLKINQDEEINAFVLNRFLTGLTYFYQEFCKENGYPIDENLTIKIRLQSRGKMGIIGASVVGVAAISGMLHTLNRPDVRVELGKYHSINASDNYLDFYNQFFDKNQERKDEAVKFNESAKQLKAMNYTDSLTRSNESLDKTKVIGK